MAPRKIYPIPDLVEWSKPKYQIQIQRDPGTTTAHHHRVPHDFETRSIRFEDNAADDTAWMYEQLLGHGGYGLVGRWVKRDETGNIVDNIVVKEMYMPKKHLYRLSEDGAWIPEEAVVQVAMQKAGCGPVLQLRGLSLLTAPEGHTEKIRFYTEYCRYGTLHGVLKEYDRLQSHGIHQTVQVPEDYLWQLLHNFTEVMLCMDRGPFDHPLSDVVGDNPYILHLDVKAENIFLGDSVDDDTVKGYPACMVGDWGLAKVTSLTDTRNSWNFRRSGTRHWYPPEQYKANTFGDHWRPAPPWRVGYNADSHPYTTAHSIFAFASIIFRLMVIDEDLTRLDMFMDNAAQSEAYCQQNDYRFIDGNNMNWNSYQLQTHYSDLLKNTIADCLHLNPAARPSAAYLENLARQQVEARAVVQAQNGPDPSQALGLRSPDPNYVWPRR